jgi:hypothetical protein
MTAIRPTISLIAILVSQGYAQTTSGQNTGYLRQATVTEAHGIIRVVADSPRPLLQTLDALQRKYGWITGYEDPRYSSHLDVVNAAGGDSHSQLPAGAQFIVEFPASDPKEEKILSLVIESYNGSNNPGRFELRRTVEGNFYVEGVAARNEKDAIAPQHPLFDLPVTVAIRGTTIAEIIDLICETVSVKSHTRVALGNAPTSTLIHTTAKVGGTDISARELLIQALAAAHRNLYWRLLFDPTSKSYLLNIHSARPPFGIIENKNHAGD